MRFFIVAVDADWGIAKDHLIPWHYKEDFKFFKERTQGCLCIMGYNTYAEIAQMRKFPEKNKELLPGRSVAVISGRTVPEEVNHWTSPDESMFISSPCAYIGGLKIYDHAMGDSTSAASYGYVTRIKKSYDCNLFFNHELLERNFEISEVIDETEDLRFEKWIRK